jgi:choline kinase
MGAGPAALVVRGTDTRFADSGSMYSLYCARSTLRAPFLLLESDLVYEPRALTHLLEYPAPDGILLSGPTGAGDEVYVEVRDGKLLNMSKRLDALGPGVAGELVGISKISAALYGRMCAIAERAFATSLQYDYETGCLVAAGREQDIACPVVRDLVWGEIDDPSHLARVRDTVYVEVRRRTEAAAGRAALIEACNANATAPSCSSCSAPWPAWRRRRSLSGSQHGHDFVDHRGTLCHHRPCTENLLVQAGTC